MQPSLFGFKDDIVCPKMELHINRDLGERVVASSPSHIILEVDQETPG